MLTFCAAGRQRRFFIRDRILKGGQLRVVDSRALDAESTSALNLEVEVSDQNGLRGSGIVTVQVSDVNEFDPQLQPGRFQCRRTVRRVSWSAFCPASDADASSLVTYSIVGGNANGAFVLDGATVD